MKRCIKILSIIVVLIFIILFILAGIKFRRINEIIELMKENSKIDNYFFMDDDIIQKRDGNIVIIEPRYYFEMCYYYDFNNKKYFVIDRDNKIYYELDITEADKEVLDFPLYHNLTTDYSFKNKLKLLFEWKINDFSDNLYEITVKDNTKVIFDKTTGYIVKISNISLENKYYKNPNILIVNEVDSEEMVLPDLSEYTKEN